MQMDQDDEFKLISCKWIFRYEDLEGDEEKYWVKHLNDKGFIVETGAAIFKPFDGEERPYNNEDYATDELKIRRWNWMGYELVDISAPDNSAKVVDGVSGIITINGEIFLINTNNNLHFVDDDDENYGFEDRLQYFIKLRIVLLDEDMIDPDYVDIELNEEELKASEFGREATKIESEALERYGRSFQSIMNEHLRLKELYLSEFKWLKTQPQCHNTLGPIGRFDNAWGAVRNQFDMIKRLNEEEKFKVAKEIGYTCQEDDANPIFATTHFTFIQWTPSDSDKSYVLVTIYDTFKVDVNRFDKHGNVKRTISCRSKYDTYLLDEYGKIFRKIYEDNYNLVSSEQDPFAELIQNLRSRIHSFIHVRNNH